MGNTLPEYQQLLDACSRPFKYYQHEFLQGKYIYIRIQDTVQRLNNLGVPWSFEQGPVAITENPIKTKSGSVQWDAVTYGQLTIEGMGSRGAPGASTNTDKDNASKAAHSFSLRKSASLFGVGHSLMQHPKEETDLVNFLNNADLTDLSDLKKAVKMCADIDGESPLAWLHKYNLSDEASIEYMIEALEKAGRI